MSSNKNLVKKIPVIINCDPGIDDAVALLIAVKSEKLDIKLIATDVGNVDTKQSAKNTLNILEMIGAENIPVIAGDGECFAEERPRPQVHGKTGMGDYEFEKNSRRLTRGDAVEEIYKKLKECEEKITIICISPPTNIAKLIKKYPDAKEKIERIVFMAGTIEEVEKFEKPYAEFNVSCDPEAGEILIDSKIPLEIVPMEMGHTAYLNYQEIFKTKLANSTGRILEIVYRDYKDRHVKNGVATHDGCAVAYVTNPEIFQIKPVYADVKFYKSINTGILTMDFNKKPNVSTCVSMDIPAFKKLYFKCLKKCK